MTASRSLPRPARLLYILASAASAANAVFVLVMLWLHPGLDVGAIATLLFLPFFYFCLGSIPTVAFLMLVSIVVVRRAPGLFDRVLAATTLFALIGMAVAIATVYLALGWLEGSREVFGTIVLCAAIGGITAGMMMADDPNRKKKSLWERYF